MPMRRVLIRFSEPLHAAITEAAAQQGISTSQYVREAVSAYLTWEQSRRGELPEPVREAETINQDGDR